MRKADVLNFGQVAGLLVEDDDGEYTFAYYTDYLARTDALAVSLTLPLSAEPVKSHELHPFFDGLIPEGWLLDIAQNTWKLNPRDRMGLLLACCHNCIGAVSIREVV